MRGVVLHIGEGYRPGFHSQFTTGGLSAHYVVYRDGSIEQWLDEYDAAYHAGITNRPDRSIILEGMNPNRHYIGIEHEGFIGWDWTQEMYLSDLWLLRGIRERRGLEYNHDTLIGHYRIDSVNRAGCPGPTAPFDQLIAELNAGI